jgi:hypothetical protein
MKTILKTGITDADQNVRKAARILYWVMVRRPSWQNSLESLMLELDHLQQKHLNLELQNCSADLADALNIMNKNVSGISIIESIMTKFKEASMPIVDNNSHHAPLSVPFMSSIANGVIENTTPKPNIELTRNSESISTDEVVSNQLAASSILRRYKKFTCHS